MKTRSLVHLRVEKKKVRTCDNSDPQHCSKPKPTDEVVEIIFAIHVDGAMENVVLSSDASWLELRISVSEKMVKPPTKLNLAYCFNTQTQAQKKIPTKVGNAIQFLEMMDEAKSRRKDFIEAKAAGKKAMKERAFKVELVDLDAGKDKEKAKSSAAKSKKKVCFRDVSEHAQSTNPDL